MLVVMANEPRYYREVLSAALRELRPGVEFSLCEPAHLDAAVAERRPQLVVCSAASSMVRSQVPAWVVLYPDEIDHAVICFDGQEVVEPAIDLNRLVAVVDEAERLAAGG